MWHSVKIGEKHGERKHTGKSWSNLHCPTEFIAVLKYSCLGLGTTHFLSFTLTV